MTGRGDRGLPESTRPEDTDTISRIDALVAELRRIRAAVSLAHPLTPADHRRLADLQTELDESWNVLRRRRSNRYFGHDPDGVTSETGTWNPRSLLRSRAQPDDERPTRASGKGKSLQ